MHPNVKAALGREYAAQKSDEWLALRGKMLTASDAATAIGVNKYETPAGLLLKKCGLGEKFMGNEATRHGEKYEDEARTWSLSTPRRRLAWWKSRWCDRIGKTGRD